MTKTFGIMLVQDRPIAELLDWAERFDQAGVDSLWLPDHLANPSDLGGMWFDAWSVLASVAERTTRARIGPLVSNFVLNPPLRMARLVVSLDALSDGRLDLGIGLGNAPVCRSAAGVQDDGPALVRRLREGMSSLIALLGDQPLALSPVPPVGGFPAHDSVRLNTPGVQQPHPPILVGGHGPGVLDVAAQFADRWNAYYPPGATSPDTLARALQALAEKFERRCDAHGRSGQVQRSVLFHYSPALMPTTRQELVDLVALVYDLGFDECIATAWPVPGDDSWAAELLTFLTDDLPGLTGR